MEYLLENSAPIWMLGAVALTMAAIVYASLRTTASMISIIVVLLLGFAGLATEHFYQTPREQVQTALRGLLSDIEANDLSAVLSRISPTASEMRDDAQALMPDFEVERARAMGAIEVRLPSGSNPTTAFAEAKIFVQATHRQSGMKGGTSSTVTFDFQREGEQWLVLGYSVSEEWREKAAKLRR